MGSWNNFLLPIVILFDPEIVYPPFGAEHLQRSIHQLLELYYGSFYGFYPASFRYLRLF